MDRSPLHVAEEKVTLIVDVKDRAIKFQLVSILVQVLELTCLPKAEDLFAGEKSFTNLDLSLSNHQVGCPENLLELEDFKWLVFVVLLAQPYSKGTWKFY